MVFQDLLLELIWTNQWLFLRSYGRGKRRYLFLEKKLRILFLE